MDVSALVNAVQQGHSQPSQDLADFVAGVADGTVTRADATRWLKAVHAHGCTQDDKVQLTTSMIASGEQLRWSDGPPVVDKHSTGGVGDKMSLMLAPALAACGCRVPMLAGRGLGHTGGTIDKLESIPGFNCSLSPQQMMEAVENVGCCIAVQNDAIAPADGVLYALRDVTDTIDSVPLITASIVSKKAAEGLDALVLDVKVGKAAFMKTMEEARELAQSMVDTANGLNIKTIAQITAMDEPIGTHIGNALEVLESVHVLQGSGSPDTRALVILQGSALLSMALNLSDEEAQNRMAEVLDNGEALDVFRRMCIQQGVEPETAERLVKNPREVLGRARMVTPVYAANGGYLQRYDAMAMATLARDHGAGRFDVGDVVDVHTGFVLHHRPGNEVDENTHLFTFHHTRELYPDEVFSLQNMYTIGEHVGVPSTRLLETVE